MKRFDFLLKNIKPGKILDVGNLDKQGKIHKILIKKLPKSEIFGIDVLDQEKLGLSFANQAIGNMEEIEFPDIFFDSVYMGQVLEHSWTPKNLLNKIYNMLKPGGVLIIDVPNVYSLSRMFKYIITGKDVILGNPDHKIFYSKAMLENLLGASKFKINKITTENVFAFRGKLFPMPHFWIFKNYGECLMASAQKNG
ncbi:MAG: SAM-dependent methyltransferase [Parcubacteria group bacterium GW2011_GWF2_40_10]|nr:MAG: SAM-dependent methyltransferase [Parcubacteria group bacterium GW2011_GWF2_40_10]OFZ53913.1 MAG: hypothetical protein A2328_03135 [Bdellovibrionales bacterium RIFOXYB2_FULL_36_6]